MNRNVTVHLINCGNEPITKENTNNTNCDNLHNQITNTNVMDSSINLSSPGLCSALQLANEIQLASIEIKKPKQCNMLLQRNENHVPKVSMYKVYVYSSRKSNQRYEGKRCFLFTTL